MSKIICEICGTTYQDTAECCPICGCSRDAAADLLGEEFLMEESVEESKSKLAQASSKKKQIFDYDEVNSAPEAQSEQVVEESNPYEEEEEYEEESRPNTFVVILLTVLIAALLLAAGFIFVRYFLPNMGDEEAVAPSTTEAYVEETTTAPSTELRIPCDGLVLTSGTQAEIKQAGFNHLINVTASPEDTTDEIVFASADESVATVSADGKITAVAEGETVVTISCGDFSFEVQVVCDFSAETEPPTTATVAAEETAAEAEETEPAPSKAPADPNVVLKLKKTDISMGVYYEVQLELDCGLAATDVEWSSEHPHIASVDENGVVKALKPGTTDIIVKYGDQEVRCRVRCSY